MMTKYGFDTAGLPEVDSYKTALKLFDLLGDDPYSVAKELRSTCGNFISISETALKAKCPEVAEKVIAELLTKPVMR
jgi:hypothetical protein